jgi:PhnB protein
MARTSTYLNFMGNTEEAFLFYKSVFNTEFLTPIHRMSEAPVCAEGTNLIDKEKNMVLHVALPITGGHILMGTDSVESMGHSVTFGNNISINLEPDTRKETEILFQRLAEGGKIQMALQDMFWGGYFGSLVDKFRVQWMVNCSNNEE